MTNFQFLKPEWPSLFAKMNKAEERVRSEPESTAGKCRLVLEECVHRIYDIEYLEVPYNDALNNLLTNEEFKSIVRSDIINGMHYVRKIGNSAAHYKTKKVNSKDAMISIKYAFTFLKWFVSSYNDAAPDLPASFDEGLIPKVGAQGSMLTSLKKEQEEDQKALKAQIEQLQKDKEAILEKAQVNDLAFAAYKAGIEEAKKVIETKKKSRTTKVASEFNEAETRKHLIDANLKEAGWFDLEEGNELEYPVTGMPVTADNPKGNGYVDYVLWDDNGKPLALVEAKRTSKDPEDGRHQAALYAHCLEQMHGQRPVIFYTNGFETKIWDDAFYSAPRTVYGFYTKDELRWHIQQRSERKDVRKSSVNAEIAGYPYQLLAIQRISEILVTDGADGLRGNKRNALLVMATGSGKTRVAASLTDVLFKNGWVKRVLFLADRNALVRQAKNSFGDHLPELSAIDLTQEKEVDTTRLVFSTYPSMLNKIDSARNEKGRTYGVGHFDLIIIDEAHRSVYNRYKAIFDYFDAILIGLTATPKDSIDHNTFELFDCSDDDPTYSFELDEATPTYLTPYNNIDVTTEFLREGIKYKDLSEEEKEKYEETFEDKATGLFPEEIGANAMNKWLFNKDTVNKVLDALMTHGLHIEGGDKLGRTIIFAVNQKHAKFIVECFEERYPESPPEFMAMIHHGVSHAQSLIDAFCDHHKEKNPQIVVSVDMMDTGIDAPRVLNLVFFKVVRSYAKFWQMIGRGTRLCPDVFGPGQPKEHFLIFDVCGNFEFFDVNKKGKDSNPAKPITQQTFEANLQLSRLLAETGKAENIELAHSYLDKLHTSIEKLDRQRFQVNMHLKYVEEFKERKRWNNLSADDVHQIEEYLSALPSPEVINEIARRFDLMMLKLQIANLLMLSAEQGYHEKLINIADELGKKYTIPQVLKSKELIEELKDPDFYKDLNQKKLDSIKEELRSLVIYLEQKGMTPIYSDIEDSEVTINIGNPLKAYGSAIYKKRVESFIRENKHQITIAKLNTNKPITNDELVQLEHILFDGGECGTKDDYIKEYGEQPLGTFVRSILGLDVAAAQQAFAEFLQAGNLRADQMTYVNNIISYLTKNGLIDKRMLFEAPFTDVNDQGLLGVFNDADAKRIIRIIDGVNGNARVAS